MGRTESKEAPGHPLQTPASTQSCPLAFFTSCSFPLPGVTSENRSLSPAPGRGHSVPFSSVFLLCIFGVSPAPGTAHNSCSRNRCLLKEGRKELFLSARYILRLCKSVLTIQSVIAIQHVLPFRVSWFITASLKFHSSIHEL